MATLGQRGDKLDLLIRQGATLGPFPVSLLSEDQTPVDLTGAVVRGTVSKDYSAATTYPITILVSNALGGEFRMSMPATLTATIPYLGDIFEPENQYVWDLEIEFSDGTVMPVFWGIVQLAPEATV